MSHQQQQNNNAIREVRKRRSALNIAQKHRFEAIFKEQLSPNFQDRKYQSLLADGVPTVFRSYVWTQLIPNYHQISPPLYAQLAEQLNAYQLEAKLKGNGGRSGEGRDDLNPEMVNEGSSKIYKWLSIIKQDIPRTFPELKIFHSDEEQYQRLGNVLGAFALFRSDVGYIQGLSLIAVLFLQQLSTQYRAFTAITTLITTTALYDYYTFNEQAISKMAGSVLSKVRERDEELYEQMVELQVDAKILVIDWVMTLFSRIFQLDSILNIWDILFAHRMQTYILEQLCVAVLLARKELLTKEDCSSLGKQLKSRRLSVWEEERIFEQLQEVPFAE